MMSVQLCAFLQQFPAHQADWRKQVLEEGEWEYASVSQKCLQILIFIIISHRINVDQCLKRPLKQCVFQLSQQKKTWYISLRWAVTTTSEQTMKEPTRTLGSHPVGTDNFSCQEPAGVLKGQVLQRWSLSPTRSKMRTSWYCYSYCASSCRFI